MFSFGGISFVIVFSFIVSNTYEFQPIYLTFKCALNGQSIRNRPIGKVFLEEIDIWSKCSTSCGEGIQEKLQACFKKTVYLIENIPMEKCENLSKIKTTTRMCNYGNCDNGYVWKFTDWSKCSYTCGYEGIQLREVECYHSSEQVVDQEMCDENKKPKPLRGCNRYNCPPNFLPKEWKKKCVKISDCSPGQQRRDLSCLSLLNTGKVLELPRAACYAKGLIPPANWRQCFDHIDPKRCFKKNEFLPEIISEKRILVQMRRVEKLKLQVGQISYVFPGTRLTLNCPVKNFLSSNLLWAHKKTEYFYKGKSKNRIRVTRKGKLIIKSFLIQDQGEWLCIAGNVSDTVVIKLKSPSDGYKDWAIRNSISNKDMPNELVQLDMLSQDHVRWIIGEWSQCSVSCENTGLQSRMVRCESLQKRFYYQLSDDECIKRVAPKPLSQRECSRNFQCPEWNFKNVDLNQCTDHCIGYEKASTKGDLKCMFRNQSMGFEKCDSTRKPVFECFNPECQVEWKISEWTKCSRSCGKSGIQARYLICVWVKSKLPAGELCYKTNLGIPQVIRSCNPPKCNLKCVDLHPSCRRKKAYCRMGIYSFPCCKTCQEYFRSIQKNTNGVINH